MTILGAILLILLLIVGFKITGAIWKALLWVAIKLPIAIVLWVLGIVLCITIIFIPLGKSLIKAGTAMIE